MYYLCDMQWTDRIRQVKIILVLSAVLIAVASLVISHSLTLDLEREERSRMEVWAEAMRTLNMADDNTNLALVLKVINENNTIPVIVLDSHGRAQTFRNLNVEGKTYEDSLKSAARIGQSLLAEGKNIRIHLSDTGKSDYIDVCFSDSSILQRLAYYPYVQLGVVLIFVVVAIFALLTSKRAEQNKVWVGLSKETAHQLGTPISSLMAWVEIMHEQYPNDILIPEMNKDVERLQLIADRFGKIGSLPEIAWTDINAEIRHVVEYMDKRTSKQIQIRAELPETEHKVRMNANLFSWVVENLCKNAVDAMGGERGSIVLCVTEQPHCYTVDISDTGKGIRKKDISNVFRPGFTTKKRGWGLGLSLAKRIIEEYHHGKIYVKYSEVGKGTTFRIELRKY